MEKGNKSSACGGWTTLPEMLTTGCKANLYHILSAIKDIDGGVLNSAWLYAASWYISKSLFLNIFNMC